MIIVKGLKVFPAQIEKKMAEISAISECAVLGVPDETEDETIKVFVVLRDGAEATVKDIQDFCRKNFDAYKRPKLIEIVESLPKNALNKTLKRVLRDQEIERRRKLAAT